MIARLKDIKVILILIIILSWVISGVGGYIFYVTKEKQLSLRQSELDNVKQTLNNIGELVTVYTVASDMKMGKKIEETDLIPIQIPSTMTNNMVKDITEVVGKYYRVDVKAGSPLTYDLVFDDDLRDDMRLMDVVVHIVPVGLKVGSYVDIRIALPLGEDFIAMSHKKVYGVNGSVLKLAVSEEDIHAYNSMLVDSVLYPGTSIYAVEYVEAGSQKPADVYYPVSKNVLAVAQKDPNLISAIKSDILRKREALEKGLASANSGTYLENESLDRVLESFKERLKDKYNEAERLHQVQQERQAEMEAQMQQTQPQQSQPQGQGQ